LRAGAAEEYVNCRGGKETRVSLNASTSVRNKPAASIGLTLRQQNDCKEKKEKKKKRGKESLKRKILRPGGENGRKDRILLRRRAKTRGSKGEGKTGA